MDNFRRNDKNYNKFEQSHDNEKWNKEREGSDKAKGSQSLADHLFATKCEVFTNRGPLPYQPPLSNIKNVRS